MVHHQDVFSAELIQPLYHGTSDQSCTAGYDDHRSLSRFVWPARAFNSSALLRGRYPLAHTSIPVKARERAISATRGEAASSPCTSSCSSTSAALPCASSLPLCST